MSDLKTLCDQIRKNLDFSRMLRDLEESHVGRYVCTGLQCSQNDPIYYVGYIVQIRKDAGSFGSDIVFIRHPDGSLRTHENQCFVALSNDEEKSLRVEYPENCGPDLEDYTEAYDIGGKYPEIGKVIYPKERQDTGVKCKPVKITTYDENGKPIQQTVISD